MKLRFCSRCGELLRRRDEVCPKCGTPVSHEKQNDDFSELTQKRKEREEQEVVLSENMSAAKREQLEKERQKELARQEREELGMSKTKQKKLAKDKAKQRKKKTYKHKPVAVFEAKKDANGEIDIDVSDSTFFDDTKSNVKNNNTGSKKHYKIPEKLKWWEIAKWADRMLARRKVKRVVNKAARQIPDNISKVWMIVLCVLFGYMGAHDFYARNWVRGIVQCCSFAISITFVSVNTLSRILGASIGGGFGFVFVVMWLWDLFMIVFNRYHYAATRKQFIGTLNFETRAILGRRYIKKEIAEMEQNEKNA